MKSKKTTSSQSNPAPPQPTRRWRCENCKCTDKRTCKGGCCWTGRNLCCQCDVTARLSPFHLHQRTQEQTLGGVYVHVRPRPQ
jgi:hypothetical protein